MTKVESIEYPYLHEEKGRFKIDTLFPSGSDQTTVAMIYVQGQELIDYTEVCLTEAIGGQPVTNSERIRELFEGVSYSVGELALKAA